MRGLIRTRLIAMMLSIAVLNSTQPVLAQKEPSQQDDEPGVKVLSTKRLSKSDVSQKLAKSNQKGGLKALIDNLETIGYKAQTKDTNYFGSETVYERIQDKQKAKVSLFLQDYNKEGSRDLAAVGRITITVGNQSKTYSFSLIAPQGKFENVIEREVEEKTLTVTRANSLWTCFVKRVKSKCKEVCVAALATCSGSWAAYLGCLALSCGGCALKAFGCCLCDCSIWCRWVVGCCDK